MAEVALGTAGFPGLPKHGILHRPAGAGTFGRPGDIVPACRQAGGKGIAVELLSGLRGPLPRPVSRRSERLQVIEHLPPGMEEGRGSRDEPDMAMPFIGIGARFPSLRSGARMRARASPPSIRQDGAHAPRPARSGSLYRNRAGPDVSCPSPGGPTVHGTGAWRKTTPIRKDVPDSGTGPKSELLGSSLLQWIGIAAGPERLSGRSGSFSFTSILSTTNLPHARAWYSVDWLQEAKPVQSLTLPHAPHSSPSATVIASTPAGFNLVSIAAVDCRSAVRISLPPAIRKDRRGSGFRPGRDPAPFPPDRICVDRTPPTCRECHLD